MQTEKIITNKVYNATKWSAITNILRKIISPIITLLLARILLPEVFGVVATINIVISFADIFTDAGFQKYLVQHEFENDDYLTNATNVAFWTNFVLSLIVWLIIFIFRNKIAHIVGSDGYGFHISVAALSIPLLSFSSIQQARFRRNFDFKSMFLPRLINTLIPLVITIPLAMITKNCWSLIVGTLVSNFSDAVLLTLKSKWKPKLYYSFDIFKSMLSFSIWTFFETLSIWLTVNIDVFILGNMIDDYHLGLYKTSLITINQITNLITTTIIPVLFAALSRKQNNDQEFKNTYYEFLGKTAFLLVPLSFGIYIFKDTITLVLLGENWKEAEYFIGLIGLMQAITVLISNFSSEIYRSKGEPKVSFCVQVIYIFILVPILLYGVSKNFNTLCLMRAISLLIFALIHIFVLLVRYKFNLFKIASRLFYPTFFAIIMSIFAVLFKQFINTFIGNIVNIVLCMLIYGIICCLVPKTRNELKIVLIGLLKRQQKDMQ